MCAALFQNQTEALDSFSTLCATLKTFLKNFHFHAPGLIITSLFSTLPGAFEV